MSVLRTAAGVAAAACIVGVAPTVAAAGSTIAVLAWATQPDIGVDSLVSAMQQRARAVGYRPVRSGWYPSNPGCEGRACHLKHAKAAGADVLLVAGWGRRSGGCRLQVTLVAVRSGEVLRTAASDAPCSRAGALAAIRASAIPFPPAGGTARRKRSARRLSARGGAGGALPSPSEPRSGWRKPSKAPDSPSERMPAEVRADAPPPPPVDARKPRLKSKPKPKSKPKSKSKPKPKPKKRREAPARPPPSAGVTAGSADDNLQFNAFLRFLAKHRRRGRRIDISRRIIVSVSDEGGAPVANATVRVQDGSKILTERRTYADGRALVFASESRASSKPSVKLHVQYGTARKQVDLQDVSKHTLPIRLDVKRDEPSKVPLDVAFVLDTTGSMGDEIARLKRTLEVIHFQITQHTPRPDVRFGMVLFRDEGDDYVTQVVPFTRDLAAFQRTLNQVQAGGGGDYPEDVQAALERTLNALSWRDTGVRLAFLIGDAPPHLAYVTKYDYVRAMRDAARLGIKITAIGCSGLDITGEVVWRQLAQYTMAPFVFLTRGETGDAEGSRSSVSHHVGANWVAEKLDAIIVRMVKLELAHFAPRGAPPADDYFVASYETGTNADMVLEDLFSQSVAQLTDYSFAPIEDRTPTVMLSVTPKKKTDELGRLAQTLERRLAFALGRARAFQLVEERDKQRLLDTIADQFAVEYDESKAVEIGRLVPARLAVLSELDAGTQERFEMLVKLVRLETGEVLSLSLLKIARGLVR